MTSPPSSPITFETPSPPCETLRVSCDFVIQDTHKVFLDNIHSLTLYTLDCLIENGFDVNKYTLWNGMNISPLGIACALKSPMAVECLLCRWAELENGTTGESGGSGGSEESEESERKELTPYHLLVSCHLDEEGEEELPRFTNDYLQRSKDCARHLANFGAIFDMPEEMYEKNRTFVESLF